MIAMRAMSSTVRAAIIALTLLAVAGCAARLPPYGVADQPLSVHPTPDEVFTMPDGTRLPVRVWLPTDGAAPQTVVLALHGFSDSRDQWALPAPVFAQNGIAVFAPDQRGFGDTASRATWPGVAALVNDADAMARLLHARYPAAKLFVMGESMGGAVVMDLAAEPNPPPVTGYVALSPAVWGRAEQGAILSSGLWLANGLIPGYHITARDVPLRVSASDNREALIALARDPLTLRSTQVSVLDGLVNLMDSAQQAAPHLPARTLVAYGGHDQLIPDSAMAKAWAAFPPSTRRAFYPNGYHLLMRDNDRQAPINDVITWMQDPNVFLPSGADIAAAAWRTSHHPGGGLEF